MIPSRPIRSKATSFRPENHRQARPRLEPLEDRSLLDVGAIAMGPELFVTMKSGHTLSIPVEDPANLDDVLMQWTHREDVLSVAKHEVFVSVIPNDSGFQQLWGMHNVGQNGGLIDADIDAPEAWEVYTGGTNKVVAIIDTGIDYTHPDLYRNIWINQGEIPETWLAGSNLSRIVHRSELHDVDGDGLITFWDLNHPLNAGLVNDNNGNGRIDADDLLRPIHQGGWEDGLDGSDGNHFIDDIVGWNFYSNNNRPFDDHSHGTHVAGIIGAIGNNGIGVTGVNWKTQLAPVKFLGSTGGGSLQAAANALNYVVELGIAISNNSWGGGGFYAPLNTALTAAQAAGHIFVAAAGNASNNNDITPSYPASYSHSNLVSVAATTRTDGLAHFSNYGPTTVDLGAPGLGIYSTVPGTGYATYSGTSMAAPHVAGALALVWSRTPNLSYSQVINQILTTVDVTPAMTGRVASNGRLNLGNAIGVPPPPADTTGARIISAAPNGTQSANRIRVTFNEAINPSSFTVADVVLRNPFGMAIGITSVTVVTGSENTQFDLHFATQSLPGEYSFAIGPTILDLAGNPMDQNTNGINGETPGDVYRGVFTIDPPPPDVTGPQILSVVPNGTASVSSLRVTFNEAINVQSFTNADVVLLNPTGLPVNITSISPVTGSGNTRFDVSFSSQTTPGTYSFSFGPMILDTASPGNPMDQNGNGINGEVDDVYTGTFTIEALQPRERFTNPTQMPIRDYQTTISTIHIPHNLLITDVDVELNITHTYVGDLMIYLRSPTGRYATLSNFRGGSGDNFTYTVFDDEASTPISAGKAPFTGSFRPDSPLSVFDGTNAKGYWTLFVVDYFAGDQGWLENWSLSIATASSGNGDSRDTRGIEARMVDAAPDRIESSASSTVFAENQVATLHAPPPMGDALAPLALFFQPTASPIPAKESAPQPTAAESNPRRFQSLLLGESLVPRRPDIVADTLSNTQTANADTSATVLDLGDESVRPIGFIL